MRTTRRTITLLALGLTSTLAISACGGGEALVENALEKRIESELGEDVELDFDFDLDGDGSGSFSIETADGSASVDLDGDGEGTMVWRDGDDVAETGTNLALPGWWPSDFPLPDDFNATMVITVEGDNRVSGVTAESMDEVADRMGEGFGAGGYEIRDEDGQADSYHAFEIAREDLGVYRIDIRHADHLVGTEVVGATVITVGDTGTSFDDPTARPAVQGEGTATVRIDDLEATVDGTCLNEYDNYSFTGNTPDWATSVSVTSGAVSNPAETTSNITVAITTEDGEFRNFNSYSDAEVMPDPDLTVDGLDADVTAQFLDYSDVATFENPETVAGTIEVRCSES